MRHVNVPVVEDGAFVGRAKEPQAVAAPRRPPLVHFAIIAVALVPQVTLPPLGQGGGNELQIRSSLQDHNSCLIANFSF